jgi:hypothetical protein
MRREGEYWGELKFVGSFDSQNGTSHYLKVTAYLVEGALLG